MKKRQLSALKMKLMKSIKPKLQLLKKKLTKNWLAIANLVLTLIVLIRIEALHAKFDQVIAGINSLLSLVLFTMVQWQAQIEGLLRSVVSLFGGEGV